MEPTLNNRVANATKWSAIAEIVAKLSGPIVNILLARLLTPTEFGVVASITIITSFADIFTDAGFQKYVIQHEFECEKMLNLYSDVAFTSNVLLSSLIYILIFIFRNGLSSLIGCPEAANGLSVASLTVLCTAFSSIAIARFRRELNFKSLFYIRLGSSFVPLIVTVPLAFLLRNYWAIVIGTLLQQLYIAIISIAKSSYKPKIRFELRLCKKMFSFSAWNLCETLSIWFAGQANVFIVGSVLTAYYLGLYKTGMSTVNSYMSIVTATISPVLFSALSRCQNDRNQFNEIFLKTQKTIALLIIPLGVGIFIYRKLVVEILLGSQWSDITDFVGLWAVMSAFTITYSNTACEVYRSKGLPQISFILQMAYMILYIPVIYITAHKGFAILCVASCLIRGVPVVLDIVVLHVKFGIRFSSVVKNTYMQFIATAVMALFGFLITKSGAGFALQIVSVIVCVCIYFGFLFCFPENRKEYKRMIQKIRKR